MEIAVGIIVTVVIFVIGMIAGGLTCKHAMRNSIERWGYDPRVHDVGGEHLAEVVLQNRLDACLNEIESLRALRVRDGDRITNLQVRIHDLLQKENDLLQPK